LAPQSRSNLHCTDSTPSARRIVEVVISFFTCTCVSPNQTNPTQPKPNQTRPEQTRGPDPTDPIRPEINQLMSDHRSEVTNYKFWPSCCCCGWQWPTLRHKSMSTPFKIAFRVAPQVRNSNYDCHSFPCRWIRRFHV